MGVGKWLVGRELSLAVAELCCWVSLAILSLISLNVCHACLACVRGYTHKYTAILCLETAPHQRLLQLTMHRQVFGRTALNIDM